METSRYKLRQALLGTIALSGLSFGIFGKEGGVFPYIAGVIFCVSLVGWLFLSFGRKS